MRVGYIIDHPKRDLPGGVMVAAALARRGVETALIPLYEQAVDVPLLALDGLVVNFARPANLDLVRGYAEAGLPVWVLDTEGGILADDGANSPHRMASYVRDSSFADVLAGYFFWGSTLHQAFIEHSGMSLDRLHLTGCPRFDYAAERWRDLLTFSMNNYVLVNANFPLVNPRFVQSPEAELGTLLAAGWNENYVTQLLDDSRQILRAYIETVRRLAHRFPERQFLLRPHPFENADFYQSEFQGLSNVIVNGAGSVLNVINHAQCVLHLNCGTAIEAVLLDKLPLSMEFLNTKFMAGHSSLPSRVSQCLASEDALIEALENLPAAHAAFPFAARHDELIQPWFHMNDGNASDRVAEVIVQHLQQIGAPPRAPSLRRSLASSRRKSRPAQRLQAVAANLLGSRRSSALRAFMASHRRDKQLDKNEAATAFASAQRQGRGAGFALRQALHPITGASLASLLVAG
jgi:surface carbohydrate biosynthesis protein